MELNDNPETFPAFTLLPEDRREWLRKEAMVIKAYLLKSRIAENDAKDYLAELGLSQEDLGGLWCLLESYERTALRRQKVGV